jgi:hypothetical protein
MRKRCEMSIRDSGLEEGRYVGKRDILGEGLGKAGWAEMFGLVRLLFRSVPVVMRTLCLSLIFPKPSLFFL